MRRFLITTAFSVFASLSVMAQMSDSQIIDFITREAKAGTSQAQIVTQLMQRGVKIDQIRRLRNQYDSQIKSHGMTGEADRAVTTAENTMRSNNGEAKQVTTAKRGTTGEVAPDASERHDAVERDVQATQDVAGEAEGKKVFGRDIFNQRMLSFEPNMNIATPQNYVLGPGDQVIVDVYGASQKTLQLTVSPEGTITVPDYGPIQISGMSVNVANAKIRRSLGSRYRSSQVKLTVGQTRTILVNVMGEVRTPGTYTLSAFATVFHALYMAGGINDLGTLRNIKVFRDGRLITIVDIYEYILNGRLAGNIRLQENDVIQVGAYDCLVGITGNIKRPMFYEMRKNESVGTLIKYAGGFTGDAYKKSVRLVRQTGEKYAVFNVGEFDMNTFKVDDGDAITIDGILNRYENMVEIKGAVFRPGMYQLGQGTTTVRSLIQQAEGVTEDAFTAHAILHRLKPDRTLQLIPVDVSGILAGTSADIPLMNEDVLFIPTQADRVAERTLTIGGEVFSPGVYQYADNTTIEDLIMQAGGLTDAASTAKVDISRRIIDPKATKSSKEIAKTYSFSLKDGFIVDGTPGFKLEPYDVVQVRRSPGFQTPRMITVSGEVMFKGEFALAYKNQRLSDAIRAAGGVTDQAYVRGARLFRQMDEAERMRQEAVLNAIRNNMTRKDSISMGKLQLDPVYPVGIDLEKALANPGTDADIVLREGDRIDVPEFNGTVKIVGDVQFPNTVTYVEGKSYKWYVNNAGGFAETAKKRKTFIIYPNGMMSKVSSNTKVEPGSEIVVPSKKPRNMGSLTQWISAITGLASLSSMVMAIAYLTKK